MLLGFRTIKEGEDSAEALIMALLLLQSLEVSLMVGCYEGATLDVGLCKVRVLTLPVGRRRRGRRKGKGKVCRMLPVHDMLA